MLKMYPITSTIRIMINVSCSISITPFISQGGIYPLKHQRANRLPLRHTLFRYKLYHIPTISATVIFFNLMLHKVRKNAKLVVFIFQIRIFDIMEVKIFDYLPEEAYKIREDVFIKEQGFVNELDEIDSIATHIVLYIDNEPVGTCRVFFDREMGEYLIGRVAVLKKYRGRNLGAEIIAEAEKQILKMGGKKVVLSAQERAKAFDGKQGNAVFGELHYDEGRPHLWMKKELN